MRTRLAVASLLVLSLSAAAEAKNLASQAGKVSVDVPDAWGVVVLQPDVMVLAGDANTEVRVLFWVVDAADVMKAAQALDPELRKYVKDIKWAKAWSDVTVNGMRGKGADGTSTAVQGGFAVSMSALVLMAPSGKALIVLGLAKTSTLAKHTSEIKAVLGSIRPTP